MHAHTNTPTKLTRDEAHAAAIEEIDRRRRVEDAGRGAMQLPAMVRNAPTDAELALVAIELAARHAEGGDAARVIVTLLDAWTRIRIDGLWGVFGGEAEEAEAVLQALRVIGEHDRAASLEDAWRALGGGDLGAERYEEIEAAHVAREQRDPLAPALMAYASAHARELFADA